MPNVFWQPANETIIVMFCCSVGVFCSSNSVSKGGFCNDTHHCICREGYDGQNCEIGEFHLSYDKYITI